MKSVEDALKLRLNNDHGIEYPDFASMWERMEQAGHTGDSDSKRARGDRSSARDGTYGNQLSRSLLQPFWLQLPYMQRFRWTGTGCFMEKAGFKPHSPSTSARSLNSR